jgi:hypothetical protein
MERITHFIVVLLLWQLAKYIYNDFKRGGEPINDGNAIKMDGEETIQAQRYGTNTSNQIEWNKQDQYFELAQYATDSNLFATAATFYSKAIKINPHPYYYMLRAYSNSMAFNLDESINDINRAIMLDPDNDYYYKVKGDLCLRALKIPDSIDAYKHAYRLGKKDLITTIEYLLLQKSAWLKGSEYLDHFYIEYWHEYYSKKSKMGNVISKLSINDCKSKSLEWPTGNKRLEEHFPFSEEIVYLNMSRYKFFLN